MAPRVSVIKRFHCIGKSEIMHDEQTQKETKYCNTTSALKVNDAMIPCIFNVAFSLSAPTCPGTRLESLRCCNFCGAVALPFLPDCSFAMAQYARVVS